MLIVLGGFLGSGRKVLARKIAEQYGIHFYDMDSHKLRTPVAHKGKIVERLLTDRNDEERMRIYQHAVKELPLVSKMYGDVILERTFHRAGPREYFLAEAARYFDRVVFIWIESDDARAEVRLRKMAEKGMVSSVEHALEDREMAKRDFQPFRTPPLTLANDKGSSRVIERLWEMIQTASR